MSSILIIGGGLIGMLTARELALGGQSVTVLDKGEGGKESSWAGGGILSPLRPWRYAPTVTALARWSQAHYEGLTRGLIETTGIDPEWTCSGLLWLDPSDRADAIAWAAREHYALQTITGTSALHGIEPALAEGRFGEALWAPDVAQVRNPRLIQALRAELARLGVVIRPHVDVTGFAQQAGRITGVRTAQGELRAERVIVAGGAWTGAILEPTGLHVPVRPVRGQMVLFKAEPGVLTRIVLDGERYLIPRRDGRILAGSTIEHVGFDKSITDDARQSLLASALALVPALECFPIEHQWAGLRPGSPAGVPYIGEHPDIRGLFVNAGHYRNGVVLGLASARLLADLVLSRSPIIEPTPYLPGREEAVDRV